MESDYWAKVPRDCPLCGANATESVIEWSFDDLRMIRSILEPGRLAFINVPNWRSYRRVQGEIDLLKDSGHFNYFTTKTLSDMCRRVGFEIITTAPNVTTGFTVRPLKAILNRLGLGDCSVLLRAPDDGDRDA